jgi:hypothetical protein
MTLTDDTTSEFHIRIIDDAGNAGTAHEQAYTHDDTAPSLLAISSVCGNGYCNDDEDAAATTAGFTDSALDGQTVTITVLESDGSATGVTATGAVDSSGDFSINLTSVLWTMPRTSSPQMWMTSQATRQLRLPNPTS